MDRYMLNYLGLENMSGYVSWNNILFDRQNNKLVIMNENLTRVPLDVINIYGFAVYHLDCSFNAITDLYWTSFFTNLQTLILDSNNLTDETLLFNSQTPICPQYNVKTLSLNNNKLMNLQTVIDFLAEIFPALEYLSLHRNPICPDGLTSNIAGYQINYDLYKDYIVKSFQKLKFLDHMKITRPFNGTTLNRNTKILKFSPKMLLAKMNTQKIYTPLPISERTAGDHCGEFGLATYKYVGKNSEGNRFISNNDL